MKQLFVLIIVLACASLALAQNTATVTQTGNTNKVDLTQTGATNTMTVSQTGGNSNRIGSPVVGDPGINVGGEVDNLALAKGAVQNGVGNVMNITQTGNANVVQQFRQLRSVYNSIQQQGNGNSFGVVQSGDNNVIGQAVYEYNSLEQVGNNNVAALSQTGGNANKLYIFYQSSDNNTAQIDQIGSSNRIDGAFQARMDAGNTLNNTMTILQQGNGNIIYGAKHQGHEINGVIQQVGNSNQAEQTLTHTHAEGYIYQFGNNNNVVHQDINMSYIGHNNYYYSKQEGNLNQATQNIDQNDPSATSHDNNRGMSTSGLAVPVRGTFQYGNSNVAFQNQQYNYNDAYLYQGGNSNWAKQKQYGNGNASSIIQNLGDQNYADVDQLGNSNGAGISSVGSNNGTSGTHIWVHQTGDGNLGLIDELGSNNAATIGQVGNLNSGSITQTGNAHVGSIVQTGNSNASTIVQH